MELSIGEGRWRVNLTVVKLRSGIVAILSGGEETHIGAVAIALPSRLAHDRERIVTSTSVFTVPGHMDDQVAVPAAATLSKELGEPVVVVAGLHVHQATKEDINRLVENANAVVEKALKELKAQQHALPSPIP